MLPKNLEILKCEHNQLRSLPPLPSSLKVLWCDRNWLSTLPDLPIGLINLDCWSNGFNFRESAQKFGDINCIKLQQHNEKCIKLGLERVTRFPSIEEWNDINERYTEFRYSPGGDMFEQSMNAIKNLLSN